MIYCILSYNIYYNTILRKEVENVCRRKNPSYIKYPKKEGRVTVKELSSKFNVTEDCIRKDLKNIEKISSIRRIYGGAVLARETLENQDTKDRKEINIPTKKIIAEKAFNLIEDRETIFLDISTINILLAKLLAESNKK